MNLLFAILAGLVAGAAIGLGSGMLAAGLFVKLGGTQEGGSAMAGLFIIGPFGFFAGFLTVFGLVLRYAGGGDPGIVKWSLTGGGCALLLGLGITFAIASGARKPRYSPPSEFSMGFEVEGIPESDRALVRWGYAGEIRQNIRTNAPFHQRAQSGNGVASGVQMTDAPTEVRQILVELPGRWQERFDVPVTGRVEKTAPWSEWSERPGHGIRFRWRIYRQSEKEAGE